MKKSEAMGEEEIRRELWELAKRVGQDGALDAAMGEFLRRSGVEMTAHAIIDQELFGSVEAVEMMIDNMIESSEALSDAEAFELVRKNQSLADEIIQSEGLELSGTIGDFMMETASFIRYEQEDERLTDLWHSTSEAREKAAKASKRWFKELGALGGRIEAATGGRISQRQALALGTQRLYAQKTLLGMMTGALARSNRVEAEAAEMALSTLDAGAGGSGRAKAL